MSAFADADILTMLVDSPDSVTFGGVTAKCWMDDATEVVNDGRYGVGAVADAIWILVQTSKFPSTKIGDTGQLIQPSGTTNIKVVDRQKLDEGAVTRLQVQNA